MIEPSSPPPLRPGESLREVAADVTRKEMGNLAFNTPKTLLLGESAEVELLLSVRHSIPQLKKRITEVGERKGAHVRITDEMEATLTGSAFDINPITAERQAMDREEVTQWKWEVEPTRTGVRRLFLTLTGFYKVNGQPREWTIKSFEHNMTIRVLWRERVLGFFGDNWKWLWTAIFVPLGLWAMRRYRRADA